MLSSYIFWISNEHEQVQSPIYDNLDILYHLHLYSEFLIDFLNSNLILKKNINTC